MKAIVIDSPNKIEIREVPMPEVRDGEALLKVKYVGICGADVASFTGNQPFTTYPRIPGHEFSAEIVEIDENEQGLKPGMIVTCNPYFNCTSCYSCSHGVVNACMDNQTMGCQRDGAFCEYITMPIERIYDGQGLSAKVLAAIEPFCISYHGVSRAEVKPGETVLVVGAGTIGVLAAIAAKAAGARVYMADVAQGKLDMAMQFGIDGTILNTSEEEFAEKVAEITLGNGFDVLTSNKPFELRESITKSKFFSINSFLSSL